MANFWTNDEIDFIKNNYKKLTDDEIGNILNRSASSVKTKRQRLGFDKDKTHRKYDFNDVINEFAKTNYILVSNEDDYINSATNSIKYICPKHLDKGVMTISLGHLQYGRGCYFCGLEKTGLAHKINDTLNDEQCNKLCNSKGFNYYGTIRKNGLIYIKYICPNHKDIGIQYMRKGNMKRDNIISCPYCLDKKKYKYSKGEKKIKKVLDEMNIINIGQYKFQACKDIKELPFDFYLPEDKKAIEYDGQHHFKPVRFNGITEEQAIINHETTIKHDIIKDQFCLENNIELLRIPYYEYNNIENLIKTFLGKENNIIVK